MRPARYFFVIQLSNSRITADAPDAVKNFLIRVFLLLLLLFPTSWQLWKTLYQRIIVLMRSIKYNALTA